METDPLLYVILFIFNFVVAVLIGATAIGGLLLVPSLSIIGGIPLHDVIPACMFAILFSGIVGSLVFGKSGSLNWQDIIPLGLAAGIMALVGSLLLPFIPATIVQIIIAILCLLSGLNTLLQKTRQSDVGKVINPIGMIIIGAITGLGSAASGTGGPLILIPILMSLKFDTKKSIGLAQAIQIPIGIFATAGNLATHRIDFSIAIPLALIVVIGATIGALIAQRVSTQMFKPVIAFLLLGCGVFYVTRLFL